MFERKPLQVGGDLGFERKVRLSTWALFFERLWPRAWILLAVFGLFVLVSLAGLWPAIGPAAHKILLVLFGVAGFAAIVFVASVRIPTREDAIRRVELKSGLPHRPASTYEDKLSHPGNDPATLALWHAHRARIARLLARLKVGAPQPRTDRHDPLAIRAAMLISLTLLLALVGESASERLAAAFRFGPPITAAEARLDAWVTPPAYTAKPPIMLSDGARGGLVLPAHENKAMEIPERSILFARTSGVGLGRLGLDWRGDDGKAENQDTAGPKTGQDAAELKFEIKTSGTMRVTVGGSVVATWMFQVIPDLAPKIALTKDAERLPRGALKLTYKVEDDYGVASAEVKLERAPSGGGDPDTAWAREGLLKGSRLPLDRPPALPLRLPRAGAKDNTVQHHLELGPHPWTGLKVIMTLQAKDHANQVGKSTPVEMVLPARVFRKPLARAVAEQRRMLVEDSRWRPQVLDALESLTLEPESFWQDTQAYLGLRSAYHRLSRDTTRAGFKSVVDQLWHVALRLDDGTLSDAQRRMRELQEQLSKALQDGATDEEIQRLMQELRQALAELMQQMMQQADQLGQPMDMPPGFDQNQMMSQQDLERMMRQIEEMARNGSRDAAQQMLSQLRDLLDRLQNGRMAQGQQGQQGRQNQQMMQMMDELGNIIGGQQRLMDDNFGQQRQQGQGQQGQRGQRGQQGQQGQQGEGGQGQEPGQGQGQGDMAQRQGQLRDQLGRLQRQLRQFGMQPPEQFGSAQEAMREAERSLERGELGDAGREQGRALEQLRQGAQSMAQQMMQQMPGRFGQGPALDGPLDPLGRPRPETSQNPEHGGLTEIPGIEAKRARDILEELRRRLGEQTRPMLELDYLERLLRRF